MSGRDRSRSRDKADNNDDQDAAEGFNVYVANMNYKVNIHLISSAEIVFYIQIIC